MPIYQTAHYQVKASAVEKATAAISEYVAANEPGSLMYTAWQLADDPTKFVHLFEFAGEAAHQAHGSSAAVRHFETVYAPNSSRARSFSPTTARSPPTADRGPRRFHDRGRFPPAFPAG